MVIDADQGRLALADHRRQVAEPAEVPDVQRYNEIGALDLTHRPVARVGPIGNQEVEALGDLRGVGDAHRYTERAQQIPEPDLAPDAVAIGVDVGRQRDVASTGECRRHVARRLRASGGYGNAVRIHLGEDNRLVPGADLAPLVVFRSAPVLLRVFTGAAAGLAAPHPHPCSAGARPHHPPAHAAAGCACGCIRSRS